VLRLVLITVIVLLAPWCSSAAAARVVKVLPHYLDQKGRHTVAPSLYERDAYQAFLRRNPDKRSGMRYDIQVKQRAVSEARLRLEVRGSFQGKAPRMLRLERTIGRTGWLGSWMGFTLSADQFRDVGEITAWRVTLWDGDELLSEQRSFLW
jgi:hypothetical protein